MVSLLLSFAAGVMTAVVCCDLLGEAVGAGGPGAVALTAAAVLAGYGTVEGLELLLEAKKATGWVVLLIVIVLVGLFFVLKHLVN